MTYLGQLPFMLFTEIARTWAVQRDSVNTVIIHSYSTRALRSETISGQGRRHPRNEAGLQFGRGRPEVLGSMRVLPYMDPALRPWAKLLYRFEKNSVRKQV